MRKKLRSIRVLAEAMERRLLFSSLNIVAHHEDAANDGAFTNETVLTPVNVNPGDFGKQFTNTVDGGDVIAEPLYMQNVNITTGTAPGDHSVVFIATEADGLYALDANTGATLWHDNFTNTTDPTNLTPTSGVTTIQQADINGNPDVGSQLGILATPAIDTNTGILYLNANTKEIRSDGKHFVQRLWAISIYNGVPVMSPTIIGDTVAPNGLETTGPYTYVSGPIINGTGNNDPYNSSGGIVAPTYPDTDAWTAAPGGASGYVIAFNAIEQMERTAVSLINGSVYLGFASHGDDGPYYGWVLGYNATTLQLDAAFNACPTFEPSSIVGSSQPFWCLGGIWMSGSGIATDGTNLYVVTGNGAFNGDASNFNNSNGFPLDHDYGDTILKLTPDSSGVNSQNGNGWGLGVSDYFTPSNEFELNDKDLDFGSGGATLFPNNMLDAAGHPMIMVGGKESRIYLLDQDNMGKFNYNYPTGATTANPALYDHVVAEYANNGLNAGGAQVYSSAAFYNGNAYIGIANHPALELNIAAMESGTLTPVTTSLTWGYPGETFIVSSNGNTNGVLWAENPGGADLLAYNASSFTTPVYDSNTNAGDALGGTIHFHVPTVADGMVYAGSRGGGLDGYGLDLSYLNSNPAYFSAPTGLSATELSTSDIHLTWTRNSSLATEFEIMRSVNGSAWTTSQYVGNTVTSYDDTTIKANTRYQYQVIAVSGLNSTAASNTVSVGLPLALSGQSNYLRLDPNGINVDVWANSGPVGGVVESVVLSQLPSMSFTGAGANSNLTIDFSNGDPLPASGLSFNGSTLTIVGDNGNDSISIGATAITVTGTFGAVPISYTGATSINFHGGAGSTTLIQAAVPGGGASVSFTGINSSDTINVSAGSMTIPMPTTGATVPVAQLGRLLIGVNALAMLAAPTGLAGNAVLELENLNLAGVSGNWLGRFDLAGNDLILHAASLSTLGNQIGQALAADWSNNGVTSSAVANESSHLTALGAITNNDGMGHTLYGVGDTLGTFDGLSPLVTDTLVKNTYYGDANVDGKLDGSDYSRIDDAYPHPSPTGWFNGDFNYDGVTDGSDYTLIDNAFNRQGLSAPSGIAITTTPQTVVTGVNSSNITVQLRNALGAAVNAPVGGILVSLTSTSSGGSFYSGSSVITNMLIPAGSSAGSVQYRDSIVGTPILTFSATSLSSASQAVNVAAVPAAAQLAFSTAPFTQAVGSISGTISVILEDASGNAINADGGGVVVNLVSTSTAGVFENSSGGAIASIFIPSGSSSTTFKYTDTISGIATLTASSTGLIPAIQQDTLTASLTSISFVTPVHTLILGASPATVTIQLNDQAGNPLAAGAGGVSIGLASNSSGGTFYSSANAAVTSVIVPAGASSVSVAYRDTILGTPTITATHAGVTSISQQQAVIALPGGTVSYYGFNTSTGLLTDTGGSGNTLAVGAGTVAYTSTNLPPGFTGAVSFSNNGYLNTSSGSFPVNVPTGNSNYTIGAWIDINNSNKNGIAGWGNWDTADAVNAFRTTQGDAGASDGAGLDNYWWANDYVQPTTSLVNNWEYVAATYNGAVRSIFVDGQLLGTFTSTTADAAAATNFHIGVTNTTEYFGGSMADLIIANTAFSTSQISELYDAIPLTPASMVFTTPAHTLIRGASPATVTIQLDDKSGNPVVAGSGGVVVNLSTNSSGGVFYNSSNVAVTSVTIPAGSSSVSVAYRDTVLGNPTITASTTGLPNITQQQSVSALPTGTVAYYGFNTSAGLLTDTSGSGNTLKVGAGTVAFTSSNLPAGFTGAASFNSSAYLTTNSGNFPVNVPTGNSSYTIAAWIDINNANKNGIVGWGTWGTTDLVNALRTTQGDTGAPNGSGLDNYWWNDDYVQTSPSLVNNWVYVAVTYNGTLRSMYANGILLGTFTSANNEAATAINFRIGSTNNGEFFTGNMADLLIANTAFSTSQIDALYNGT